MPSSLEDYEFISSIGSGSYGSCAKIRRIKDGKVLVWKALDYLKMSDAEKQMLVSEVNLLRELKHERIVRYYDRIIDRRQSRLYIVMEYCEGGDLAELIARHKKDGSRVEESFAWQICRQVASALQECHCRRARKGKSVMHRDLKPANVFLDARRNVKLGDFGMARVLNHETSFASTFVGTPYYMSPELMNGVQYNERSDVWSLGCLLYELCALAPPFQASSHTELAQRICAGRYPPLPALYSADLRELIALLLQVEGARRPSIDALLLHPLLLKHHPPACALCGHANSNDSTATSSTSNSSSSTGGGGGGGVTESLRRREEALAAGEVVQARLGADLDRLQADLATRRANVERREREVERRERDVERRERGLVARERLVEERMNKAERLLEEYADARLRLYAKKSHGSNATLSDSDLSDSADDLSGSPPTSSLSPDTIPPLSASQLRPVSSSDYSRRICQGSLESDKIAHGALDFGMISPSPQNSGNNATDRRDVEKISQDLHVCGGNQPGSGGLKTTRGFGSVPTESRMGGVITRGSEEQRLHLERLKHTLDLHDEFTAAQQRSFVERHGSTQ